MCRAIPGQAIPVIKCVEIRELFPCAPRAAGAILDGSRRLLPCVWPSVCIESANIEMPSAKNEELPYWDTGVVVRRPRSEEKFRF